VHKNRWAAASDEIIHRAVKTFEEQFFRQLDAGFRDPRKKEYLTKLLLLDRGRIYELSGANRSRVVVELVNYLLEEGERQEACSYARFLPDNPACTALIKEYEASLAKPVEDVRTDQISVSVNQGISSVDATVSLFKSKQEVTFFLALRRVFPTFEIYPNVALSCLVEFEQIVSKLSQEERNYFFKAIVDFVVFDQFQGYKPIHFFELDSAHHDTEEQKVKDQFKNKILGCAGQKLFRIRRLHGNPTEMELTGLILEILKRGPNRDSPNNP
jgi:hypothetical protein